MSSKHNSTGRLTIRAGAVDKPQPAPRISLVAIWLAVGATAAFLPGAMDRWVFPKLALAVIAVVAASLAPAVGRLPRWILIMVVAAVVSIAASALLGEAPIAQLWGRWPRYEGAIAIPVYVGVSWLGARLLGARAHGRTIHSFYCAVASAAILIGVLAIFEALGWRLIPSNLARPGSLLGNASDQGAVGVTMAGILAVPLFAALGATRDKRLRHPVLLWLGLALCLISIVLSASRTALATAGVMAVTGVIVLGVRAVKSKRARTGAALSALLLIAFIAFALAVPLTRSRVFGEAPNAQSIESGRGVVWNVAIDLVAHNPIAGVGPNGFMDALQHFQTAAYFNATGVGVTTDSPHNIELQILATGGAMLGLVMLASCVGVAMVTLRGLRAGALAEHVAIFRIGGLCALMGYGATLQTTFTSAANVILPMMLIGAIVAKPPLVPTRLVSRTIVWTIVRLVLLCLWASALLLSSLAELPLQTALTSAARGNLSGTLSSYSVAQNLRPWDTDITLMQAQTLTAMASVRVPGASSQAVRSAARAVQELPHSVLGQKALAAALEFDGQYSKALVVAMKLNKTAPYDPETAQRIAEIRKDLSQVG